MGVSGNLWIVVKDVKSLVVYDVNTELLNTKCRGIGPQLAARGKSHGFPRVPAGTWGIFSSYDGDAHSKREFV